MAPVKKKSTAVAKKKVVAKKKAEPKMLVYRLLREDLGMDTQFMMKLYDENSINPKTKFRQKLIYSENHATTARAEEQDTTQFPLKKGYAVWKGDMLADFLSYTVDASNKALKQWFDESSFNVANGGSLFEIVNKEEEAREELEAVEKASGRLWLHLKRGDRMRCDDLEEQRSERNS